MADSRTVTFKVDAECLRVGIPSSKRMNAICLAMEKKLPDATMFLANTESLEFQDDDLWFCKPPGNVVEVIRNLQAGRPVSQFQFTAVFERA